MSNTTRFMVLPDGTCAPLEGCMIIDVPNDLECDDAELWISCNADYGYGLGKEAGHGDMHSGICYYDLINNLLMDYSDEQLMATATMCVPDDEYFAIALAVTDEDCDVLDPGHVVITSR